ncbi:MAG TPA: ABC transporter permease [Planctomycetaceae bacterium]|jgi:putative ABC transport system permease protein
MDFLTLRIALRALAKNKLRAGLTVLGLVIGIAAVSTMVSLGQSASALVQSQFEQIGTNVIVVIPGSQQRDGISQGAKMTLTTQDAEALAAECPSVLATTPLVLFAGQVIYGNSNFNPREMYGVGADYLTVRNWPLRSGSFFSHRDLSAAAKVCIIGQTLVARLFQTSNPLGQTIRIKNIPFKVIGVLEPKGANLFGQDQDNVILMPSTSVRKRLHGSEFDDVNSILVSARSLALAPEARHEIIQLLAERHRIQPGDRLDFTVQDTAEIARVFGTITGTLTLMLSAIAGISLLVGGVGIMNIMLVSVTERTREIGIRMAVGARSGDILRQFLVEAVLLSMIGGLIGFFLGIGASTGATMLINSVTTGSRWPVVISLEAGAIAFVFSAAVGVFFGYYPARRASRLDPIEALRYE